MIAVLFALEREATPFRRAARRLEGVTIAVSGIGRKRAGMAAEALLAGPTPPGLVIAAGFCGALWPATTVGTVIAPAEVVDESGRRWACDPAGRSGGRLLTTDWMAATPADKRMLVKMYTADAVDMESAAVAAACEAKGVRFAAVRAVSDTAEAVLSPRLVKLLSGGHVSPLKAVAALIRQPSLIGEFWRLARDTRLAAKNLAAALVEIVAREGA